MTSIAFTGDISFTKYMTDGWKREDLLDETVTEFLHSADHVVANVECALSNDATTGTGLKHASDPAAGAFIRDKIGADIWSVANNHILDCKAKGLLDTLQTAREHGCLTIGAGANKEGAAAPVILEEAGGIGIFSVVYDYEKLRTPEDEPGVLIPPQTGDNSHFCIWFWIALISLLINIILLLPKVLRKDREQEDEDEQ